MTTSRKATVKAWAGFSDGKLYYEIEKYQETEVFAIFRTRWQARKHYQDVRRVQITVKPSRRGK